MVYFSAEVALAQNDVTQQMLQQYYMRSAEVYGTAAYSQFLKKSGDHIGVKAALQRVEELLYGLAESTDPIASFAVSDSKNWELYQNANNLQKAAVDIIK